MFFGIPDNNIVHFAFLCMRHGHLKFLYYRYYLNRYVGTQDISYNMNLLQTPIVNIRYRYLKRSVYIHHTILQFKQFEILSGAGELVVLQ